MSDVSSGGAAPPMPSSPTLLWRRDLSRSSYAWSYWVAAGLLALTAFGVFAGFMAEDPGGAGSIAVLGLIGAGLFFLIPRIFDRNKRKNPEIHLENGYLRWAKVDVPITQIVSWSMASTTHTMYNGTTWSWYRVGTVHFRLVDESKYQFSFPHMNQAELDELRPVLAAVIPVAETTT